MCRTLSAGSLVVRVPVGVKKARLARNPKPGGAPCGPNRTRVKCRMINGNLSLDNKVGVIVVQMNAAHNVQVGSRAELPTSC